jgi:rhodanese-related sulfurtransferase
LLLTIRILEFAYFNKIRVWGMFGVKEIDALGLQELMDSEDGVHLIDVRSAAEYNRGIISGGEFMPLHTLPLRLNDLPKDKTIVFYCRSGARSAQACSFTKKNIGLEALNLRGGIISWHQSGLAITAPTRTA